MAQALELCGSHVVQERKILQAEEVVSIAQYIQFLVEQAPMAIFWVVVVLWALCGSAQCIDVDVAGTMAPGGMSLPCIYAGTVAAFPYVLGGDSWCGWLPSSAAGSRGRLCSLHLRRSGV